jgi:cell division protein FtsB
MAFIQQRQRPKPHQKLSPVQEGRVMKIIVALLVIALLWIFFAPGAGLVTLLGKRSELKKLEQDKVRIEQNIDTLQKDIDRLNNDLSYLEEIARKEHGLLKKNEKVFDFSTAKPEKK